MQAARQDWRASQPTLDVSKLVFLDETGASTNMTRAYGRAPKGQRCRAAVPHGHWKTTTLVAGLRVDQITAPRVLDGPMDGKAFLGYVRQCLCPTLRPGDIVSADNLPSHKARIIHKSAGLHESRAKWGAQDFAARRQSTLCSFWEIPKNDANPRPEPLFSHLHLEFMNNAGKVAGVREAIEARGASLRLLPAYSPDFNPIENLFAKLKALLKKAAHRTVDGLWQEIGVLLDAVSPEECANYFKAAGYPV